MGVLKLRISGLRLLLLASLLSMPAFAADKAAEARAQGLTRDAMEQDYLATNFKAALAKLDTALRACGGDKCGPELVAKIHANRAIVFAAGLNQKEDAIEAFKAALKLDAKVTPDSNYLTGPVQAAFDEARNQMGPAPVVVDRSVGVLKEKPWAEQALWNPVPVYVELPEGVTASRVVVRYKAPGLPEWKELQLRKHDEGYGGYIPCPAVQQAGELLYFVTAFDTNLDRVASAGSAKEPRKIQLKQAINGRQPALPGSDPPTACPRPEERLSCETNDDCPGTQVCNNLQCVDESSLVEPDTGPKTWMNWLGIAFSPDISLVKNSTDACSPSNQSDASQSCFYGDGTQFTEIDTVPGKAGTVNSGVGTGSMRILLSYDRVLLKRMTVGARVGFAFLGSPKRDDGESFFPVHLEARFAFHLTNDPFSRKGVRPYAFVNGGAADSVARVGTSVVVNDTNQANGQRKDNLDVYQKGGRFFVGGGLGVQYAVNERAAMVLDVAARQALPDSQTVIAPALGFAYGL